jgi:membrane-associated phospholipid phosphatase
MSMLAAFVAILLSGGDGPCDAGEDEDTDVVARLPRRLGEELPTGMFLRSLGTSADPGRAPDAEARAAGSEGETPHGSFSGFFDLHGSSRAWKETVWDQYLTQPAVLLPLSLGIATVVAIPYDRRLEHQWQGVIKGRQNLGNIGVYSLIGVSALTGLLFPGEDRNSWDESWTVAEAFLCSYLTSSVLKSSVHRLRPGHGTNSFPSGHSAMAFTGATLIERNLGPYAGIPAYLLAAFTAFERVESGRHFPSDIFAGAAIGTLSAGIIDALHWGRTTGEGGIATRSFAFGVDMQGLHDFDVQIAIRF